MTSAITGLVDDAPRRGRWILPIVSWGRAESYLFRASEYGNCKGLFRGLKYYG